MSVNQSWPAATAYGSPADRIVLATASPHLQDRVSTATGGSVIPLPAGPLPADTAQLLGRLGVGEPPTVLIVDAALAGMDRALDLAAHVDQQCPATSVVLVSDLGDEIALPAMRAGVRDVLRPDAEIADIRAVLDRAAYLAHARWAAAVGAPQPVGGGHASGRVISVTGPKGGVGKTTVATNLAVGLAEVAPHSVVLVDLDIQFGDVASALNLTPEYTLPDAVHGPASSDTMVLKTFLTLHSTGLYVVCGSESPAAADAITAGQVGALLRMLASEFQYVVVDTAPGLSEHTLAAMDISTDLVLVTSLDVPGVRGLRKEIHMLSEINLLPVNHQVILNFAERRSDLSAKDVEATIGVGVDLLLPRSKLAAASQNQGVPILLSAKRDPLAKQLRRLVTYFSPAPAPALARRLGRHYAETASR